MLKVTETLFKDSEIAVCKDLNLLLLLLTHCGFTLQLDYHLNKEQEFADIYMHASIYAKNPPPKLKHQTLLLRTQGKAYIITTILIKIHTDGGNKSGENEQDIKELYIPKSQATGGETSNFIPQFFSSFITHPPPPKSHVWVQYPINHSLNCV